MGGCERFRFDFSKFFNDQTHLHLAEANLAAEINKCSENSKLWIGVAGKIETVYRGLKLAAPDKRKYLMMVSHSAQNEKEGQWCGQHGRVDCEALGATYVAIKTGNGCGDAFGGGSCDLWEEVHWLRDSPSADYRWIYTRLEATRADDDKLDASDCTMAYYMAYNDENGNFVKLQQKLGTIWYSGSKPPVYPKVDQGPAQDPQLAPDPNPYCDRVPLYSGTRIVMEAEEACKNTTIGGWHFDTTHKGYSGDGYLFYTGEVVEGIEDELTPIPLCYRFIIEEAGRCEMWIRGRRDHGDACPDDAEGDACNDIFAKLDDGEIKKTLVKPAFDKGWDWGNRKSERLFLHQFYEKGLHVLQIGGRSRGVKMDQIVFVKVEVGRPPTSDYLVPVRICLLHFRVVPIDLVSKK